MSLKLQHGTRSSVNLGIKIFSLPYLFIYPARLVYINFRGTQKKRGAPRSIWTIKGVGTKTSDLTPCILLPHTPRPSPSLTLISQSHYHWWRCKRASLARLISAFSISILPYRSHPHQLNVLHIDQYNFILLPNPRVHFPYLSVPLLAGKLRDRWIDRFFIINTLQP